MTNPSRIGVAGTPGLSGLGGGGLGGGVGGGGGLGGGGLGGGALGGGGLARAARRLAPSRLQIRRLSAYGALFTRSLATAGLVLAAALSAGSGRGAMSLAFLTAAAFVAIAVVRAYRAARYAAAALRLHRAVKATLDALESRGWHLEHHVRWPARSGEGHLAMTPAGDLAFAIKDCMAPIDEFDLARTQDFATALARRGPPCVPICVAAADDRRSLMDRGVLCSTPQLLVDELLDAEGAFLASLVDEGAHNRLLYEEGPAS